MVFRDIEKKQGQSELCSESEPRGTNNKNNYLGSFPCVNIHHWLVAVTGIEVKNTEGWVINKYFCFHHPKTSFSFY